MTVFYYNFKRLLKRKNCVLAMLILPIIIMMLTINVRFYKAAICIAVIDNDKTEATLNIINEIGNSNDLVEIKEEDIQNAISLGKIDYAVIIENGFTNRLMKGKADRIKILYSKNSNIHNVVDANLNNYLNSMKNIAVKADGNKDKFYSQLKHLKVLNNTIEVGNKNMLSIRMILAFLIMFILIFSVNNTMLILKDTEKSLNIRTLIAPISTNNYLTQCILSLCAIAFLQVTIEFVIILAYYNITIISSIFYLYIVLLIFAFVSVFLSMFICAMSKKVARMGTLSSLITVPICMLGGCFWSMDMAPQKLKQISLLMPVTWAMNAVDNIIFNNYNLLQVKGDIVILLMFGVVFLMLGIGKKKDLIS